jgi:eukaryotic-like serine/threonine-protein kinase
MVVLSTSRPVVAVAMAGAIAAGLTWGCSGHRSAQEWPTAAGNLAGTRAAVGSGITARNVARLRVRWRFTFSPTPRLSRSFASTPVADADTVYAQGLHSNVFALDRATGTVRWVQRFHKQTRLPSGLTVDEGRVYGETDSDAFALAASNGRQLWRRRLTSTRKEFAAVAPVAWKGLLFLSMLDPTRSEHGTVYALDAATGVVRWKFAPVETPGPVSIDASGRLYTTTSKLALDAQSGRLLRRGRGTLGTTPILATNAAYTAGTSGHVIAWNRETMQRLWDRAVRPGQPACRGVGSAMAYADDRLFVPVADLCSDRGVLIALDAASGSTLWKRHVPSPDVGCATVSNSVVFTSTDGGVIYAFATRDGRLLWHSRLRASVGACPAVVGDTLLVRSGSTLVAFELP